MNPSGIYAAVISLASLAAAVQPSDNPVEIHAALAIAGNGQSTKCSTAACISGWHTANSHAIMDIADCPQVSDDQHEIDGCKAFVNDTLQERLENQW